MVIHRPTIQDFENTQLKYKIVEQIEPSKLHSEYIVVPKQDRNCLIRTFYLGLTGTQQRAQYNLIRLSVILKHADPQISLSGGEFLMYPFLTKLAELQYFYAEMMRLWRRQGEYSIIVFTNRFPIVDEILVCAVRVYLVTEGLNKAVDFNFPLEFKEVEQVIIKKFTFPSADIILNDKLRTSVIMELGKAELETMTELISNISPAVQSCLISESVGPTIHEIRNPRPSRRKNPPLRPLHNMIFYSLLN